ncbi:MAG: hypothetical protein ACRD2E_14870 [Terriglobales bacterium]
MKVRICGLILALATALAAQQLHPVRAPQPQLPTPAPGTRPSAPPAAQKAQPAAPAANANALPGQQFTPSPHPWVTHNYSPQMARHDLQVAHFYAVRHNYAAVLSRARSALRHAPHWPPALYVAGDAAARLRHWELARKYWNDYLRRDPGGKKVKAIRKALRKFPAAPASSRPKT